MILLMMGCEYVGTTTLAVAISKWIHEYVGGTVFGGLSFHDHFKLVEGGHVGLQGVPERQEEIERESLEFSGRHRASYHHYQLTYHVQPTFFNDPHHLMIGMHFDDEIYGPLHKGYGEDQADFLRKLFPYWERQIVENGADTILILVKAAPEVIRRRMTENPHPHPTIGEGDVAGILARFEEAFNRSIIGVPGRKMTLDTSTTTVEETLAEFVRKVEPMLSNADRLRVLTHRSLTAGG